MSFTMTHQSRYPRNRRWFLFAVSLSAAGLLLGGCADESNNAEAKAKKIPSHLVEIFPVKLEMMQLRADREGTLRALREVKIFNQEEGRIMAVRVREGDTVNKGQILVQLDDRLLRAEYDKTRATLNQEKLNVSRMQKLISKKLISEDALARAQTALEVAKAEERALRTRLSYMTIKAPFNGQLAERKHEPGDVAPKHTHLLTVVDLSSLVTDVPVSELILPQLKIGDEAQVRIDALGKKPFKGRLSRIYPTVDPATRRGMIEVVLEPVPPLARPGLFCRVTLHSAGVKQLVVPYTALRRGSEGEFVYVFEAEHDSPEIGTAKRVNVVSGLRYADMVAVEQGLTLGQDVIAKGFIALNDGKPVKAVNVVVAEKKEIKQKKIKQSIRDNDA
jgi:RND family efflux transporter MFP subunit